MSASIPAAATTGTTSLAEVLDVSNAAFDRNWENYDIVTAAVLAVLAEKPDSPVGVLADGSTELTAFIPNDRVMLPQVDLNAGNKQIAHGIDRVLLPIKVSR